jgi:hypothetical protein
VAVANEAGPAPSDDGGLEAGPVASSDASVPDSGGALPSAHVPCGKEAVNVARKGPYDFKTYSEGLSDPVYASAIMYYPDGAEPP